MQEDLDYFLPPHKAAKAFEILDRDQDGRVSLHDIRDAILQIYKVPAALPLNSNLPTSALPSAKAAGPACVLLHPQRLKTCTA